MLRPWIFPLTFNPILFYNIRMKNTLNEELAVCGFAAVKTLEKMNWQRIQRLYFTEQRAPLFGGLCKKLSAEKRPYNVVEPSELEKLCGSVHHQGVVAMISIPEILPLNTDITARWLEQKEDVILLDRVGNANNLGAIVRSAAFFGVKNIVIPLDEAQSSITTSSYRVAEGGMEFVNIYSIKSIPKLLAAMEGKMLRLGTALDAPDTVCGLKRMEPGLPVLAVLGNEESGISKAVRENVDRLILIPYGTANREKTVDSLNVAQASAVLMYEMAGRRRLDEKRQDDDHTDENRGSDERWSGERRRSDRSSRDSRESDERWSGERRRSDDRWNGERRRSFDRHSEGRRSRDGHESDGRWSGERRSSDDRRSRDRRGFGDRRGGDGWFRKDDGEQSGRNGRGNDYE